MIIAPLACLIFAASPDAGLPGATQDPVSGVWKGLAQGDGPLLPTGGLPLSLCLRRTDTGAQGQFSVQGFDASQVNARFDPRTSVLEFESSLRGIPSEVRATLAGDELEGTLSGMEMKFHLRLKRFAREVLDAPPAPKAPVDVTRLETGAWAEDLEFLAAYLPQVHVNAYHTLSAEEWRGAGK